MAALLALCLLSAAPDAGGPSVEKPADAEDLADTGASRTRGVASAVAGSLLGTAASGACVPVVALVSGVLGAIACVWCVNTQFGVTDRDLLLLNAWQGFVASTICGLIPAGMCSCLLAPVAASAGAVGLGRLVGGWRVPVLWAVLANVGSIGALGALGLVISAGLVGLAYVLLMAGSRFAFSDVNQPPTSFSGQVVDAILVAIVVSLVGAIVAPLGGVLLGAVLGAVTTGIVAWRLGTPREEQ